MKNRKISKESTKKRIQNFKQNVSESKVISEFWRTILLSTITAIFLVIIIVALPQTERLLPNFDYNLDTISNYKESVLEINIGEENPENFIPIINRRLHLFEVYKWDIKTDRKAEPDKNVDPDDNFLEIDPFELELGAESISTSESEENENDESEIGETEDIKKSNYITVSIVHPEETEFLDQLLSTSGDFKLMIKNDQSEDYSEENEEFAYLLDRLESNYSPTDIDKEYFRSYKVRELVGQSEDDIRRTQYLIMKPKYQKEEEIKEFLLENSFSELGVLLDESGFVYPFSIYDTDGASIFLPVTYDESLGKTIDIAIHNPYPAEISNTKLVEESDYPIFEQYNFPLISASIIIFITIIITSILINFRDSYKGHQVLYFIITTILLIGTTLAYKKVSIATVDPIKLAYVTTINTIWIAVLVHLGHGKKLIDISDALTVTGTTALLVFMLRVLGNGLFREIATDLLPFIVLAYPVLIFAKYYV
ncbi:MAG TPA: hypothetical protein ENN64_01385, partial [bacterium]|nr:hypothetical protein [bacterium]